MNRPHENLLPMPGTEPLLELDEASVMLGARHVLDRLSLRIRLGEHTALLGANGSGKSTLVKLIDRQLYPLARDDGRPSVRIFGRDRWSVAELRGLLGIVSPAQQADYAGEHGLTAYDAVVSAFFAARVPGLDQRIDAAMAARAGEALARMHVAHLAERPLASLSTGEARRVLIARALVHRPRALLLDEPCSGLDLVSRRHFLDALRELAQAGTTLLLVTHHIEEIVPEIGHVAMLRHGRLLHHGAKHALLDEARLGETFGQPVQVERRGEWYWATLR
ncbi:ABC transporter ATP-binding protein [Frateuria sp. Soil773]|uniref:ABC transporter ATP-binding protein n=1 Tax=Frateuria sp. Soil773 TaxID=1736407 RepID=UPI0006F272AB|nr:ATP-binding cassette domain-containing protein [Frateuria sp. Soil773]KRF01947.1 ABC transporter ATP-binding protein [Frateuria sp. Soil773]